jgi:hypothetical protein
MRLVTWIGSLASAWVRRRISKWPPPTSHLTPRAEERRAYRWYGAGPQPGKAGCDILKGAMPMPLNWPEDKDTYYCYQTSEGLTGWLQVLTYVSQPFPERRLIFSFATYE